MLPPACRVRLPPTASCASSSSPFTVTVVSPADCSRLPMPACRLAPCTDSRPPDCALLPAAMSIAPCATRLMSKPETAAPTRAMAPPDCSCSVSPACSACNDWPPVVVTVSAPAVPSVLPVAMDRLSACTLARPCAQAPPASDSAPPACNASSPPTFNGPSCCAPVVVTARRPPVDSWAPSPIVSCVPPRRASCAAISRLPAAKPMLVASTSMRAPRSCRATPRAPDARRTLPPASTNERSIVPTLVSVRSPFTEAPASAAICSDWPSASRLPPLDSGPCRPMAAVASSVTPPSPAFSSPTSRLPALACSASRDAVKRALASDRLLPVSVVASLVFQFAAAVADTAPLPCSVALAALSVPASCRLPVASSCRPSVSDTSPRLQPPLLCASTVAEVPVSLSVPPVRRMRSARSAVPRLPPADSWMLSPSRW